ncbi:sugar kinase [Thermoflavimicrobium dichotomicum]|uniref:2-dehydro-3-deoxygluconokinase n=1 Tax=Thermoflavimicrobium dichotomicum TaxID=46223 RepID=A0A1I3P7Q6_9BACL|nr:sugar kinase [Thermoflavimicrobium dichotomicum]SFJ17578.1 2-dehydro-3-deoxygluconokinase [Thermoflavimicrobium dichotomicum]
MDVVTVGETMVMFTPQTMGLLRYAKQFVLSYAGAETNVAIGLSRLGHRVGWISQVGQDEFGESLLSFVRGEGIDVSEVKKHPTAPTGLMFKEYLNKKELRIYYYRHQSAASMMNRQNINKDYISQAKFLHITGITPALSESCREMVFEAIQIAKHHGVKVVFDPNYRAKLWDTDTAKPILLDIAAQSDIILPGLDEGTLLVEKDKPEEIADALLDLGAKLVVVKLGPRGAYYQSAEESGYVSGFPVDEVVDPVGAGDAFAAGFLSGMLEGISIESAVQRANAVAAMVVMVKGDYEGLPERETLMRFMNQSSQDVHR